MKVVPLWGEAIPTRRTALRLLLLCAVAPAAVGCQQTSPVGSAEQRRINQAAQDYILRVKGWQRSEFRIEPHGLSPDGTAAVVWAVNAADERSTRAGGGLSLALHVDRRSLEVIKELHFQ